MICGSTDVVSGREILLMGNIVSQSEYGWCLMYSVISAGLSVNILLI